MKRNYDRTLTGAHDDADHTAGRPGLRDPRRRGPLSRRHRGDAAVAIRPNVDGTRPLRGPRRCPGRLGPGSHRLRITALGRARSAPPGGGADAGRGPDLGDERIAATARSAPAFATQEPASSRRLRSGAGPGLAGGRGGVRGGGRGGRRRARKRSRHAGEGSTPGERHRRRRTLRLHGQAHARRSKPCRSAARRPAATTAFRELLGQVQQPAGAAAGTLAERFGPLAG